MLLPRANPEILVKEEHGDFFLLDTESGEVYRVNATAARIFSYCQAGSSYAEAVRGLATLFRAEGQEQTVLEDVQDTVRQLQQLGLCRGEG
jgi:hypothetical protein